MKTTIGLIRVLFSMSIFFFLVMSSYQLVMFLTNFTNPQQHTIEYLNTRTVLSLPYTAEEISHLNDVRAVMKLTDYFFYGVIVLFIAIILWHRKNQLELIRLFWYAGVTTVSMTLLIIIILLLSFNGLFTLFHQLFFPQGNWQFPIDSLLIQTFPLDFFITISSRIFLTTLILGSLFILLSFILKRHASQS